MTRSFAILTALFTLLVGTATAQRGPVIDVHLHSYNQVRPGAQADWAGREDARALAAPATAEEHLRATSR